MRISAKCGSCGSSQFRIPEDGDQDQTIYCDACQSPIGDKETVLAELKAQAARDAKKKVGDMLEKSFKGKKGFTFKRK